MKKTSKLFGAVALSAALALGCAAPAFAESKAPSQTSGEASTPTEFTGINANGEGTATKSGTDSSTVVNVSTYVSQLSVTIPLKLPVVLDRAGGFGKAPTKYYIQNNSGPDIQVTKASYKILTGEYTSDWNFPVSVSNHLAAGSAPTEISSGTNPENGTMLLSFKPTTGSGTQWFTTVEAPEDTQEGSADEITGWDIKGTASAGVGSGTATARQLAITVQASSSVLAKNVATGVDVAGIVYTVALPTAE